MLPQVSATDSTVASTANSAPVISDDSVLAGSIVENATVPTNVEGASIISNGGFDSGTLDGWVVDGDPAAVTVQADATSGNPGAEITPTASGVLLTQNTTVNAGSSYLISFSLQGGSADSSVGILLGGAQIFTVDAGAYADATTISLQISTSGDNMSGVGLSFQGSGAAWHVDNFSIVPVTSVEQIPFTQETSGFLNFTDADLADTHTLTVTPQGGGYLGAFTAVLTDSTNTGDGGIDWDFAVDNSAISFLHQGETLTQTYDLTLDDGNGGTVTRAVTVTIAGADNHAPVAADDAAAVAEDGNVVATGNVLGNDSDADRGTVLTVAKAVHLVGQYGTLDLAADGSYSYVLDNTSAAVQGLGAGQSATDVFEYQSTDGIASSAATLTITIAGANDAPVAHDDSGNAQEDGGPVILAASTLLGNDTDADIGDSKTIVAVSQSASGAGVALVNGDVVYTPGALFQSLGQGATATDTFTYTMADSTGAQSTATVTMTVTGVNDAPVVLDPIADRSIKAGVAFTLTVPAGTFGDVDAGDTLAYSASLANGDALPSWLKFDAVTQTFSGTPEAGDAGNLTVRVGATDSAGATAFDDFALAVEAAATGKTITGTNCNDDLRGTNGDDTIDGRGGADWMAGGRGNDTYIVDNRRDRVIECAGEGTDTVRSSVSYGLGSSIENLILTGSAALHGYGNSEANLLVGNAGANVLWGGSGNDILQGLGGNDTLANRCGNSLFDGGTGNDVLIGGSGNEMFIGGTGNDMIATGAGADIIAINAGSGADVVDASTGSDNTLSLGGGIRYGDLKLSKRGSDLVLGTGGNDKVTLAGWYAAGCNKSVSTLQVIAEAMAGYDPGGSNPLLDNKVERFDFKALVHAFDAAGHVDNWSMTDALLSAHLSGSDTEALGGDLAYQYGANGTLSGIGLAQAQGVLNAPQFGKSAQALHATADLKQGDTRLS